MIPNPVTGPTDEDGNPECYTGPTPVTDAPDRREFQFAVLNCVQHNVQGNSVDVPVLTVGKAFMTEAVDTASGDFEFVVEVIGTAGTDGEDGYVKEIVQIYR